ncbi:hypothetical protein BC829DRAFT_414663 [Chytridium lagenaria]|nr:hypothetical protein BC829DRAFT_414663 [Chytridium lagenaria]
MSEFAELMNVGQREEGRTSKPPSTSASASHASTSLNASGASFNNPFEADISALGSSGASSLFSKFQDGSSSTSIVSNAARSLGSSHAVRRNVKPNSSSFQIATPTSTSYIKPSSFASATKLSAPNSTFKPPSTASHQFATPIPRSYRGGLANDQRSYDAVHLNSSIPETLAPKLYAMSASTSLSVGQSEPVLVKDGEVTSLEYGDGKPAETSKVDVFWIGNRRFGLGSQDHGVVVDIVRKVRKDTSEVLDAVYIDDTTGVIKVSAPPDYEEQRAFQQVELGLGVVVEVLGRLVNDDSGRWIDSYVLILKQDPLEDIARYLRMQQLYTETYFRDAFDRLNSIITQIRRKRTLSISSHTIWRHSFQRSDPFHHNSIGISPTDSNFKTSASFCPRNLDGGKANAGTQPASANSRSLFQMKTKGVLASSSSQHITLPKDSYKTPSKSGPVLKKIILAEDATRTGQDIEGLTLHTSNKAPSSSADVEISSSALQEAMMDDMPFALSPFKPPDNGVGSRKPSLYKTDSKEEDDPTQSATPLKKVTNAPMLGLDDLTTEAMLMVLDEPFDPDEDTGFGGGGVPELVAKEEGQFNHIFGLLMESVKQIKPKIALWMLKHLLEAISMNIEVILQRLCEGGIVYINKGLYFPL